MQYVIKLKREDNTLQVKRITRSLILKHVGRRGPKGDDGEQGPPGEAGASEWGQLTGNIADQTDLQAALDEKYDASNPDGFITAADMGVASLNGLTGDVNVTGDGTDGGIGLNVFHATDELADTITLRFRPLGSASGKVLISEVGDNAQSLDFDVVSRVTTITSSATPTINTDSCDAVTITALATDITSMTDNLTGTPNDFDKLIIRIKDNGTARAITWGASFEAKGTALPTTTIISKVLTVGLIYDSVTAKWGCVASAKEA